MISRLINGYRDIGVSSFLNAGGSHHTVFLKYNGTVRLWNWLEVEMKQKDNPTIERIRETRHRISEEHSHDPQKIVEYYLELQKKYEGRFLDDTEEAHSEPVKV